LSMCSLDLDFNRFFSYGFLPSSASLREPTFV
jgi:hypothetical protein